MKTLINKLQAMVTEMTEGQTVTVRLSKRFKSVEVSNQFKSLNIPNCGCIALTTGNAVEVFKLSGE